MWNLWWGGRFFIRFRNIFPMLFCALLLCIGLNQTMCLFLCFLLLTVFICACYLKLYLYPNMPKASWYRVTESLKISSEEDNHKNRDLMEKLLDYRWWMVRWDYRWLFDYFLFDKGDKLNFQGWLLHLNSALLSY